MTARRLILGCAALGAVAYFVFLLASFPAATAYRWFAPAELRLSGVQGTLWSGRAALGSVDGLALRDLRWRIRPLSLLAGRTAAAFEARLADGFVQGEAGASWFGSRAHLSELQASTSLPALRGILPVADTTGLASLDLERLALDNGWPVDASGLLRVAQLEVAPLMPAGGELIPLGNFELSFVETGGRGLAAELRDAGGPLEVSGSLELALDGSWVLEGFVRARAEASADLVRGLELMTDDPDAEGRRAFRFDGTL